MAPGKGSSKKLFAAKLDTAVEHGLRLRAELRSQPVRHIGDVQFMASLDNKARQALEIPHVLADAFIGEVFGAGGYPNTTALSIEVGKTIEDQDANGGTLVRRARDGLRTDLPNGRSPRRPFHWPIEFPEVFRRHNPGFDAIVGNPPFLGGRRISTVMGAAYNEHLAELHTGSSKNADLVAHFFRRAFALLRQQGNFGLLATNSIAEGDTRQGGLEWMLRNGSTIYAAYPNEPWPGSAAVITSRVHVRKGTWDGKSNLLGRSVQHISAFLSEHDDWSPQRLKTNQGIGFQGSILLGMGFVLTPDEASHMIDANPRNAEVLFPYLNGHDLNTDPAQYPSRWVINFWDWSEERAKTYRQPYEWIRKRVYPERLGKSQQKSYRKIMSMWWLHWNARPALYHAIGRGHHFERHPKGWVPNSEPRKRVLTVSRVSKTVAFSFTDAKNVFSDQTVVFSLQRDRDFAVLQSSIHAAFAWQYASRLKSDLRYGPTDALEPFPFPTDLDDGTTSALDALGSRLHDARREVMDTHEIGLTKLYNRFHDESDRTSEIAELRGMLRDLDQMVMHAYGCRDLDLGHGFHEVAYLPEHHRVRFTISETARVEILHRLAALNREHYEGERNRRKPEKTGIPFFSSVERI